MAKRVYTVTESEAKIIGASGADPDIFAAYWFKPEGDNPWLFDDNFTENGKWQKKLHLAAQTDIVVIGGFGTGKTIGVGMSACVWGATTPNFKFLNVAEKAWQAKQMYDYVLTTVAGTPFEKLVYEKPRRPFPMIVIKYIIGGIMVQSTMEFMSADKDATGILSWEGDWINIEEAGLLDNLEEIVTSVGSRLRGSIRGRARLGRLSMISNSWDNPYLWYNFDLATQDPDLYLSMVVSTRDNKNVTPQQFAKMLARIPIDERDRFIEGTRPEGKGSYFAKNSVYACEDQLQGEMTAKLAFEGVEGNIVYKMPGVGIYYYQEAVLRGRIYFLIGDPGTGKAPNRNAPVIMVWDVTDFPNKPAKMVAFWWGDGGNQIMPFVNKLIEWDQYYAPMLKGIDATGPQKNTHEIINLQFFNDNSLDNKKKVLPLDFSAGHKMAYLVACRLFIEGQYLRWPKLIAGIRSQLTNYDPLKDKQGMPKIPQDIVSAMAMASHVMRVYFNVEISTLVGEGLTPVEFTDGEVVRYDEQTRNRRTERGVRQSISRRTQKTREEYS